MTMNRSVDQLMTAIFLLLAVTALILFFVLPDNRMLFWIIGGVAVLLRVIYYIIRLVMRNKRIRHSRESLIKDLPEPTDAIQEKINK